MMCVFIIRKRSGANSPLPLEGGGAGVGVIAFVEPQNKRFTRMIWNATVSVVFSPLPLPPPPLGEGKRCLPIDVVA